MTNTHNNFFTLTQINYDNIKSKLIKILIQIIIVSNNDQNKIIQIIK